MKGNGPKPSFGLEECTSPYDQRVGDDGEQVQPWLLSGLRRVRRWQRGHAAHYAVDYVTLGELPDGRWIAEHSDVKVQSRVYRSRPAAERRITELMWNGRWEEVPAEYDAAGKPVGDGWVRLGSAWVQARSEDTPEDR